MKNKKILIIALIFSIVLSISSIVLAIDDPDFYKPNENLGETTIFSEMVSSVLGVISVIGIFVAVAGIMIIGIKTIFGSVEEKADYKKKILPFIIGAIILFVPATAVRLIYKTTKITVGEEYAGYSDEQFTEGEKWVANLYNTYGNFIPLDGNGNIDEKTSTNNIKDFIEKYKNKYSSSSEYYQDGIVSRRKNIFKEENRKWYNAGTTIVYDGMDEVLLMKNLIKYKRAALAEIAEIEDSTYYEYVESLWDNFIKGVKKELSDGPGPVYVN